MKTLLPVLLCALGASCVTASDLRVVADSLERLEKTVDDETATPAEVQAAVQATKDEIRLVAERVEERTETVGEDLAETGGIAGVLVGLGMVALNSYRNKTRPKPQPV